MKKEEVVFSDLINWGPILRKMRMAGSKLLYCCKKDKLLEFFYCRFFSVAKYTVTVNNRNTRITSWQGPKFAS